MGRKAGEGQATSSEKCQRPYQLGQREVAMNETRTRILAAARELITGENAMAGFSMEAVAKQAGITRMTVYHHFSSKRGLLEALFDDMAMRGRLGEKLPAAFACPDALEALQAYIKTFCEFWESDRFLTRRLRGFALLDKEFEAAIASRYERRHYGIKTLLQRLSRNYIEPARTEDEALMQTLLALTSFEFYDVVGGEGDSERTAAVVFQLVRAALSLEK